MNMKNSEKENLEKIKEMHLISQCGWAIELMCTIGLCVCDCNFPNCLRNASNQSINSQCLMRNLPTVYSKFITNQSSLYVRPKSKQALAVRLNISHVESETQSFNLKAESPCTPTIISRKEGKNDNTDIYTLPFVELVNRSYSSSVEEENESFGLPSLCPETAPALDTETEQKEPDQIISIPISDHLATSCQNDPTLVDLSSLPSSPFFNVDSPFNTSLKLRNEVDPSNINLCLLLEKVNTEVSQVNTNINLLHTSILGTIERKFKILEDSINYLSDQIHNSTSPRQNERINNDPSKIMNPPRNSLGRSRTRSYSSLKQEVHPIQRCFSSNFSNNTLALSHVIHFDSGEILKKSSRSFSKEDITFNDWLPEYSKNFDY